MNILFVTGHPAQVHNFRNVRAELIKDGHNVFWLTTPKDIATNLLDQYQIPYARLMKANSSFISRVKTMVHNTLLVIRTLRKNKIDVCITRTDPYTAIAAWLCRVPNIMLQDTEHAAISKLQGPFARFGTAYLEPECFSVHVRPDEMRWPGNVELFYLHPKRFTPKPVWDLLRVEPNTRFAIVRFVKWDAFHDTQLVGGFTLDQKRELITRLSKHLRVFISSESELPPDLESYRIHIPIERMHDVQAAAALFVGESATMASESVVLGTLAIYIDEVGRGYTDEEAREDLLWMFRPVPNRSHLSISNAPVGAQFTPLSPNATALACSSSSNSTSNSTIEKEQVSPAQACSLSTNSSHTNVPLREQAKQEPWWIYGGVEECIAKAEESADPSFDSAAYAQRHKAWMATKIDCTAFLTWFIENYPQSVEETKRGGAEFWKKFK